MIKCYMYMKMQAHNAITRKEKRLARHLIRYRFPLLLALVATCLVLAPGLLRLEFNSELSVLLPESDPLVSEQRMLQNRFAEADEISFAIAPDNGDVFSTPSLQVLARLQQRFRDIPGATQIASLLNHETPYGEVSIVPWPWQNLDRFSPEEREQMRQQALDDPLVRNRLIDGAGHITFVTVTLDSPTVAEPDSTTRNRRISEAVASLLDTVRSDFPTVAVAASAGPIFEHDTRQAMIDDLTRLLPLTIVVCVLFIAWCFGSMRSALVVLGVALLSVLLTLATLGLMGRAFNTVSIMAPLVIVMVAVADAVHLLSLHRQRLKHHGPVKAMSQSLALNLRPVTLATLTTAIGFASLSLVSAPALSDFGTTVAIGVGFAWLVTFMLLPALVPALYRRAGKPDSGAAGLMIHRLLEMPGRISLRHDRVVFFGTLLLALVCLALLPLNRTDFNRMDFVATDSALHEYSQLVNTHMDRGPVLTYGIMATENGGMAEPALLHQFDRFAGHLRSWPDITGVASLVELVRGVNAALPDSDSPRDGQGRIPDTREAVQQHLSDYRIAAGDGFPLSDFIDEDQRISRFFVSTRQLDNGELVALDRRLRETFGQMVTDADILQGSGTLLFARMDDAVTGELLRGYALSLALITLTLVIGLRSLTLGLISILPNALPAIIVFGLRGLFDAQIDPFILMLFSISIGLVVDDTVHILSNWQRGLGSGLSSRQAMDSAVFRAGPALLVTTLVLCIGSLLLLNASTLYFQEAAKLLVPIVALALLLDLTFLPTLLQRLGRTDQAGSEPIHSQG